MEEVKLAVVDDQALFRKGLVSMLGNYEELNILFEAENGLELFEALEVHLMPEIILLDLRMPKMDGLEAITRLKSEYPNIKVIIISVHDDSDVIEHLIEKGANAYLDKNANPDEVIQAIHNVKAYDFHFNHAAQTALKEIESKGKKNGNPIKKSLLSEREEEVLIHICREHTTPEIADKMALSPRTIEGYREKLLTKSGARNTAGLVLFAVKNQIISTAILKLRG